MKHKLTLFCLFIIAALSVFAAKYTTQTERVAFVGCFATWTEGQTAPDTVRISAQANIKAVNDTDPLDIRDIGRAEFSFDGLRVDRSATVGANTLTYRQITLLYLKMVADAKANP